MNHFPLTHRTLVNAVVAALATTLLLAACGEDDQSGDTTASASIAVTAAWARTSSAVATAGAVYLTIANTGGLDDALIGASVDPSVAGSAGLHESVEVQTGDSTSMTSSEEMPAESVGGGETMMEMRPVDRIVAPANGSVALEPGGYHIMLMDLVEPLEVGSTIDLTLTFDSSGDRMVTADVRDTAP